MNSSLLRQFISKFLEISLFLLAHNWDSSEESNYELTGDSSGFTRKLRVLFPQQHRKSRTENVSLESRLKVCYTRCGYKIFKLNPAVITVKTKLEQHQNQRGGRLI